MLNDVNLPSAARLSADKIFRFYAKNRQRKICIYAKKCVPLYSERWEEVFHLKLKLLNNMKTISVRLTLREAELIKQVLNDVNEQSRELLMEACNRGNADSATPEIRKECKAQIAAINSVWKTANDLWLKISQEILNQSENACELRLTPEALQQND